MRVGRKALQWGGDLEYEQANSTMTLCENMAVKPCTGSHPRVCGTTAVLLDVEAECQVWKGLVLRLERLFHRNKEEGLSYSGPEGSNRTDHNCVFF